ncbi:RNA 2',3'-cyclic phosphodiesterase [Corynebacterium kefirresidentii]|uniref:RNA 2',3'-cyclic phosphodiesterase n=1 Tax=Corynebacterium TaxID=1716 RepID=UPI0003B7F4D5|nr:MULTISPECIES: RNA 2',3'-cyclic phosphodiesterase [Corynebacterium]WKS53678.1 RNA 2',3'-cyclic phosphodiesterase [Corynebacterium tuberculostearicum]ERS46257.1 2'-5' RNA ligase [Corynebacterium sp. KPL1856]ERS48424.1 2'-5' RNA ligase [Corynebacterium sp. KPL1860]ERS56986.1 2'-5' RNA ligase [Corynebacterium sp. KPL1821]ERS62987.1 2'-5' RNA ligase [Corynebacterium sp. KPL1817]
MIRVFAALSPSAAAREHLVHTLRPIHAATTNELRWTDPDNWHVTMAFYGDQPNDAAAVREHLAHAVAGRGALDVHLSGAGSFEQRTLWVGVGGQARGVRELMAQCQLADVPFSHHRPHLTVARAGRRTRELWALADYVRALSVYRGPDFRADRVCLMQSHLGEGRGGGPRYEVIEEYPLF